MSLSSELSKDLYEITNLTICDTRQIHMLIIDFFAAAYAGYRQNRAFNQAVEAVVFPQGGAEESFVLFQEKSIRRALRRS